MKIILLLAFLVSLFSCSDSSEVTLVKNGVLESCPNVTVETMVNGYMSSPSWEGITFDNGMKFVNITGGIQLKGEDAEAVIQFKIISDSTFAFQAVKINNTPTPPLIAGFLLLKMCKESGNNDATDSNNTPKQTNEIVSEPTNEQASLESSTEYSVMDIKKNSNELSGKLVQVSGIISYENEVFWLTSERTDPSGSTNGIMLIFSEEKAKSLDYVRQGCSTPKQRCPMIIFGNVFNDEGTEALQVKDYLDPEVGGD